MASIRWNDACQIVRLHHPSAPPEAICWCGSGCLSVACSGCTCFYGNPEHCHKADLDHYTHLSADQRCSPQFQIASTGDMKVPLSLSISSWVTDSVCTLCSPLLWNCLCLADVDKCLGLACLGRSLRDAQRRLSFLLWLSPPNTESLKFLERFSQQICEPTLEFILFWLIQTKESTNGSITSLFSFQS